VLGWEARMSLEALCDMMVKADLARVERGVSY
jgi:GDP-D-mannose dehydratase